MFFLFDTFTYFPAFAVELAVPSELPEVLVRRALVQVAWVGWDELAPWAMPHHTSHTHSLQEERQYRTSYTLFLLCL
jgi:hypothetical protein